METILSEVAALRNEVKSLTKLIRKIRSHQEDPTGEKAKARAVNNGFNRSLEISQKLRDFLNLPVDESISRSEVTRRINTYITDNDLKHPANGRMIILDEKLTDLLAPPEGVQVTFLNIQRYLSPHYVKVEKPPKEPKKPKVATPTLTVDVPVVADDAPPPETPKKRVVVKKPKA